MKFYLRLLRNNPILIFYLIWILSMVIGGLWMEIAFIMQHGRLPVSSYEIMNWLLGLTP